MLVVFNKPFSVLSQFTPDRSPNRPLSGFNFPKSLYPIGRLDADSEGLLLLSDEADLNQRLLHPHNAHSRTYWAQVERIPNADALTKLKAGLQVQDYKARPCHARILDPQPTVPPRDPPIRFRKNVPDIWLELILIEGKNRQVRRMTAAVGHPTLRLIRIAIGQFRLGALQPGEWKILSEADRKLLFD